MKKTFLLKSLLLLCALIVGSGTMWAEDADVTYDFTASGWTVNNGTLSNGTVSFTGAGGANFKMNSGYFMMGKKDAYINFPTYTSPVSKIVVTGNSGASASTGMNIFVGNTAVSTETTGSTGTNTYEIASGYQTAGTVYTLKVTSAHNAQITKIEVFFASSSPLDFITLSGTYPTSFTEGDEFSHEGMTVTATYEDESTADVTSSASFTGYDMTVLGQNQTVTVSYSEGEVTKTAEYTIIVNALPSHNVTWSVNGTESEPESYKEGEAITFPENPNAIGDYVFVGWITTPEYPTGDTPELITSATMGTTDITYYAVYAKVSQDGEPEEVLNQTLQYDTWTYNGTTTDKSSYRLFGNESYVESASFDLSKLSKVKIFGGTYGGQDTYKTVTIGDGTNVWKEVEMTGTGNAKEHSFTGGTALTGNKPLRIISTCGNGSSNGIRMSKIEIYVLQPTISYSDHTTTVEPSIVPAITVADPTINVDAAGSQEEKVVTYENITITSESDFGIKYYDAVGEESSEPEWIVADVEAQGSGYVLSCTVAANDGEARTAYLKVYAMNGDETIYSNLVTITQAQYVSDYATLPFEFDFGRADIEETNGLTQNGLGSDYASSPKLKFDSTGDYLVLKIDEAPGKLTFDIVGNSFSGGTFKVQTSADGETFTDLASYTSIGSDTETKEFDDLADNVRYIKWVYTEKVSGNVGLGNIKLAKPSTDPVIRLAETSVEVDAKQHDGTIALTYKNLQIDDMEDFSVQFFSDEQGTVTTSAPEWVEALVAEQDPNVGPGYVLSYVINANDGAARTAYLRVYADDGVNSVASDVVTITQAKFVKTTTYTLAHAITPGKHYVIASGDVGTVYVMGKQKSTNRDAVYGAEVNFSEVLSVTEDIAADVREFIISKDGNYYTIFDFDENESGYLFASSMSDNHLKTQATNNANGQWTITIDEKGVATLKANMTGRNWMRFNKNSEVFSCYNNGQQDIYLFEKENDEGSLVIPIAAACTDGTNCFGTFSSTKPFVVPEDLTVSEIGIDTDGTMNVENYDAGAVVPANTGVMVSAAAGDRSYVANVSTEVGNNVLNGDNRLRPTGDNGLTALEMNSAEPETCKFYRLTMHEGTKLGFWWGADGGLSFDIAANKAYLAVPASVAGARNGFAFGDDATGISQIENGKLKIENCYDLQGRKVSKPGKGLYIVNGKKVVIK